MLEVFAFDLSKNKVTPGFLRDLRYSVTAAAWIDSDTTLAVAYDRDLVVIDTLSKYPVPIQVNAEWGVIRALAVEAKHGRLVYGTDAGITVICDMKRNYERICHLMHGNPVTCIGCVGGIVVIGCENGALLAVGGGSDNGIGTSRLTADHGVRSVGLAQDMVVAAGDSKVTAWLAR
jgi:hypothetical protein